MGTHWSYDNSSAKLVDAFGNELAYFGGNSIHRLGGNRIGLETSMMPPGKTSLRKTYFVDGTHGNDANNGLSWKSAYATFEKAIDQARFTPGTTDVEETVDTRAFIFIAPGHYDEQTQLLWSGHQISIIGCGGGIPGKGERAACLGLHPEAHCRHHVIDRNHLHTVLAQDDRLARLHLLKLQYRVVWCGDPGEVGPDHIVKYMLTHGRQGGVGGVHLQGLAIELFKNGVNQQG